MLRRLRRPTVASPLLRLVRHRQHVRGGAGPALLLSTTLVASLVCATGSPAEATATRDRQLQSSGCRELLLTLRVPAANVAGLAPAWYPVETDPAGRVELVLRLYSCVEQRLGGAVAGDASTATLGITLRRACGTGRGTDVYTLSHLTDSRRVLTWLRRHSAAPAFEHAADVHLTFDELAAGAGRHAGGAGPAATSPFTVEATTGPAAAPFPLPLHVRWWTHEGDASVLVTNDLRDSVFRAGAGSGSLAPRDGTPMAAAMAGGTQEAWVTGTFDRQLTTRDLVLDASNPYWPGVSPAETSVCRRTGAQPPGR